MCGGRGAGTWRGYDIRVGKKWLMYCSLAVLVSSRAGAQKKITCQDGDHYLTDIKQIAIQYEGQSLKGTLSSLSILGASLSSEPKKLQEASETTQLWNEFIKALVVGFNSCAITKAQYHEALQQLYPKLKQDAVSLEGIRKEIAEGRKADRVRFGRLLDAYFENLRRFVVISGNQIELERIAALVEKTKSATDTISTRLDELQERVDRLEKPAQVQTEIRKRLVEKADEAESAYNQGYASFDRFRFDEAASSFRNALRAVKLPEFYLALGLTYRELQNLSEAEQTLCDGLALSVASEDRKHEGDLSAALGTILFDEGEIDEAVKFTQQAVSIEREIGGPNSPDLARDISNLGQLMRKKGDMEGARRYTQEALTIAERVLDPYDWRLATLENNWAEVLNDRLDAGDAEEALRYTRQALATAQVAYGGDSFAVALYTSNIGKLLQNKALKERGDFAPALSYAEQASQIAERIYGPDHPWTAMFETGVGAILANMENYEGALAKFERAFTIDQRAYGTDHPSVARDLFGIANCLLKKRDFGRALAYAQRASEINEKIYGSASPNLSDDLKLMGTIQMENGDLDGALMYKRRALDMDEKIHGPDNIEVAHDSYDVGLLLLAQGKLSDAKPYFERALAIEQKVLGPNDNYTMRIKAILARIQQQMQNAHDARP